MTLDKSTLKRLIAQCGLDRDEGGEMKLMYFAAVIEQHVRKEQEIEMKTLRHGLRLANDRLDLLGGDE